MRSLTTIAFLIIAHFCNAQTVSTYFNPSISINDGIVFDSAGNLYGTDHEGYGLYKLSTSGDLTMLAAFNNHPNGIVLDKGENIYVAVPQGNKIYKLDSLGNIQQFGPQVPNPNGLLFEYDSDTLIVTSYANNTLSKLAPDGTLNEWISGNGLNGPLGLCYDDEHTLYVSNFNDGKMFKVVDDGLQLFATVPGAYLGSSYFSTGYIMWFNNYVYATGYAKNIVYRVDTSGIVHEYAGSGYYGYGDGAASTAEFKHPNGIAKRHDHDEIYISDYDSHTIRVITEEAQGFRKLDKKCFGLMCYPNPVKNKLVVKSSLKDLPEWIDVCDVLGKVVYSLNTAERTNEIQLDLSEIASGVYVLRAFSDYEYESKTIVVE